MLTGNMLYVSSSSLYRNGKGYLNDTVHFSKRQANILKYHMTIQYISQVGKNLSNY